MSVHNVRTEGAFLVCAVRKADKPQFVRVKSLAGEPLRLYPGNLAGPFEVVRFDGSAAPFQADSDGTLTVTLARNDDVVVKTRGTSPELVIAAAGANTKRFWGLP